MLMCGESGSEPHASLPVSPVALAEASRAGSFSIATRPQPTETRVAQKKTTWSSHVVAVQISPKAYIDASNLWL
jgi:hypothetical protein